MSVLLKLPLLFAHTLAFIPLYFITSSCRLFPSICLLHSKLSRAQISKVSQACKSNSSLSLRSFLPPLRRPLPSLISPRQMAAMRILRRVPEKTLQMKLQRELTPLTSVPLPPAQCCPQRRQGEMTTSPPSQTRNACRISSKCVGG
ncbi:uncharacterized protein SPPG_08929 [Spizellomyces punctatus DAOM BR117]|uniref:Uncharacterized protein n=1 Tax=Spizellomyces punctatus (strain DAOM BR117) TaxID=645134 RepID=A0A0L0HSN0_SPIPD|nr:uncharacterized protein SPPG_08929 [Spizellomyces punctatus DAOM BR117]KND03920.1 hypothetical protein SPPG_08929 [Spizellomyces punctatus DAOM BR117]|eukprot:XP_016611959.1 hypothetical protein SPPG_08929 [Spizellomyces punctatus DAOM BR117]